MGDAKTYRQGRSLEGSAPPGRQGRPVLGEWRLAKEFGGMYKGKQETLSNAPPGRVQVFILRGKSPPQYAQYAV